MSRTNLPDDYSQATFEANHGIHLPPVADSAGMRSTTIAQLARENDCYPWEVLEAILELYPDMHIRVDTSGGQRLQIRRFIEGELAKERS